MNPLYCLRRAASQHGGRIALHHEDREITYRDFSERVEGSARKLAALGLRSGDRVAVLMHNSPLYLDLYYSVAMAGGVLTPLNTRWHINEVVFTLCDSGARFLIVDDKFAPLAAEIRRRAPEIETILFAADWDALPEAADATFAEPHEDDLYGLFYTSGTTGGPKGAMLTHRNFYANATHFILPPTAINTDWKFLHVLPMSHLGDAGFIHPLTLTGATHCMLPTFDAEAVLQAIESYRVTHMILVPTMVIMILNHPNFGQYDLSSLRRIVYGASPMPLPVVKQAMEKLPGREFIHAYGMTETTCMLTSLAPEYHTLENSDRQFAPVKSSGRPAVGVEIRVVDNEDRDVSTGEVGEILARGPNVMKGYWNRPEITAEVLRGGWMHTGDLGALDQQGFLYILDRKKDMIKTGSENVYSPEVESVVCAHPAVLEAVVIGVPHDKWGETIRAVVVLHPGATLTEGQLVAWCRERLAAFKCPTSAVFTDVLPKGGTGKVQKSVLREHFGATHGASA